jgi:hypothetical protein
VLRDWFRPTDGWQPLERSAWTGALLCFAAFLIYAAANTTGFLFLDHANLMIHEAGHALFAWGGQTLQILGGTIAQILVPLAVTLFFIRSGQTAAVAFTAFWGFENFLYIATYMGDARTAALPLVGADESDWAILFSQWGILHLDRTIAAWTRAIGWIGMVGTVAWLAVRGHVE